MSITQPSVVFKRLREFKAFPAWFVLVWQVIGVVSQMDFIAGQLRGVLHFISTPAGNLTIIASGLAWLFAVAYWPRSGTHITAEQIYIAPDGLAVWIVGDKAVLRITMFSGADVALKYLKATISPLGKDTSHKAFNLESGEPSTISAFTPVSKTLERSLTPEEERRFEEIKRVLVNGVAYFADDLKVSFQFLTTAFR